MNHRIRRDEFRQASTTAMSVIKSLAGSCVKGAVVGPPKTQLAGLSRIRSVQRVCRWCKRILRLCPLHTFRARRWSCRRHHRHCVWPDPQTLAIFQASVFLNIVNPQFLVSIVVDIKHTAVTESTKPFGRTNWSITRFSTTRLT